MRYLASFILLLSMSPVAFAVGLIVDLKTNHKYDADFKYVRVEIINRSHERVQRVHLRTTGGDFARGVRVAEFQNLRGDGEEYTAIFELLDHRFHRVDGKQYVLAIPEGVSGNRLYGFIGVIAKR